MRLFLDLNVVLDVLAKRDPWAKDSSAVLSFIAARKARGYLAAHSVTTLQYLLRKHLGAERAAGALIDLLGVLRAAAVDHDAHLEALSLGWADFEDAVQAICALRLSADYIVTRDPKPFGAFPIPAVSPSEILAIVER